MTIHQPQRPARRPRNAADVVGRPWDTTPGRVALAIFTAGSVAFALLLAGVVNDWSVITELDAAVTTAITDTFGRVADLQVVRILDLVLSPLVLRLVTLVVAVFLFRSGLRRVASWLAGTVAAEWLVTFLVKQLVQRPRPAGAIDTGLPLDQYAFPSGHALTAALLTGALLFVGLQRPSADRNRVRLWVVALAVGLVIGVERVVVNVHHVSDVLAGWSLALALLGVSMLIFGVTRPGNLPNRQHRSGRRYRLAAVVNPTKIDDEARFRRRLELLADTHGWAEPLWLETTENDPGHAMARTALEAEVDLVIAAGGDGTVRAVCAELAGTGVAVGVVPVGTGNLLARNLGLPLDHEDAIEVALTGYDRAMDLVRIDGDDLPTDRFAVMAGLGLDAAVVGDAPAILKARVGWAAYVVSIARNVSFPAVRVEISVDGGLPETHRARMVVIGNVGHLHGGLPLLPDAAPDDGYLDVVLFAPRRVTEWPRLAWRVLRRSRKHDDQLTHWRGRSVVVRAADPVPRQLDGDLLPEGRELRAEVEPGTLIVRVPRPEQPAQAYVRESRVDRPER